MNKKYHLEDMNMHERDENFMLIIEAIRKAGFCIKVKFRKLQEGDECDVYFRHLWKSCELIKKGD